jgi:hypothetical protein
MAGRGGDELARFPLSHNRQRLSRCMKSLILLFAALALTLAAQAFARKTGPARTQLDRVFGAH